jgi:hypothetical protein
MDISSGAHQSSGMGEAVGFERRGSLNEMPAISNSSVQRKDERLTALMAETP